MKYLRVPQTGRINDWAYWLSCEVYPLTTALLESWNLL